MGTKLFLTAVTIFQMLLILQVFTCILASYGYPGYGYGCPYGCRPPLNYFPGACGLQRIHPRPCGLRPRPCPLLPRPLGLLGGIPNIIRSLVPAIPAVDRVFNSLFQSTCPSGRHPSPYSSPSWPPCPACPCAACSGQSYPPPYYQEYGVGYR